MWKKILFLSLVSLAVTVAWNQDSSAKTWRRWDTTLHADSVIAAIERGDSVIIERCEILGPLVIKADIERPDTIESYISVRESRFRDSLCFSGCCFLEKVILEHDTLAEVVRFFDVTFDSSVGFYGTAFKETADFSFSRFRGPRTIFTSAVFIGRVLFSFVVFRGETHFWGTRFTDVMAFLSVEFESIYITWEQLNGHMVGDPLDYFKLMKHFEDNRQLDDSDGLYGFLKNEERMRQPWYVRYPEYWFIQQTCGYGVKPERVLLLSILIVLGFTFFYAKSDALTEIQERLRLSRRRGMLRRIHRTFRKRLYNALYFSFQTFIIGVVPDWHPTDNYLIQTRRIKLLRFRTLAMIEGALGWILLVLFVVTLTRKFIR